MLAVARTEIGAKNLTSVKKIKNTPIPKLKKQTTSPSKTSITPTNRDKIDTKIHFHTISHNTNIVADKRFKAPIKINSTNSFHIKPLDFFTIFRRMIRSF